MLSMWTKNLSRSRLLAQRTARSIRAHSSEADESRNLIVLELQKYSRQGQWRESLEILDFLDKKGHALDSEIYEYAVEACTRGKQHNILPGLLQNMLHDSIPPTSNSVVALIDAFVEEDQMELVDQVSQAVVDFEIPLSLHAFRRTINTCFHLKDGKRALQTFLASPHLDLISRDYANVLRSAGIGGEFAIVPAVLQSMQEKDIPMDSAIAVQIIRTYISNDRVAELDIFVRNEIEGIELPEPTIASMLSYFSSKNFPGSCKALYKNLCESNMELSVHSLGLMVTSLIRSDETTLARQAWHQMKEIDEVYDERLGYSMILACKNMGKFDLLVEIYDDMQKKGIFTSPSITAFAIRAYGKMNKPQNSLDIYTKALEDGHSLCSETFVGLMYSLGKAEGFQPELESIWKTAQQQPVTEGAYRSAVHAFVSQGMLEKANEVFLQARDQGPSFDLPLLYAAYMTGLEKINNVEEMKKVIIQVLDDGVSLTDSAFLSATNVFINHKSEEELELVLALASQLDFSNPVHVLSSILRRVAESSDWDQFQRWNNICVERELWLNVRDYRYLLRRLAHSNQGIIAANYSAFLLRKCKFIHKDILMNTFEVCLRQKNYSRILLLYSKWNAIPPKYREMDPKISKSAALAAILKKDMESLDRILPHLVKTISPHEDGELASILISRHAVMREANELVELYESLEPDVELTDMGYHGVMGAYSRLKDRTKLLALEQKLKQSGAMSDILENKLAMSLKITEKKPAFKRGDGASPAISAFHKLVSNSDLDGALQMLRSFEDEQPSTVASLPLYSLSTLVSGLIKQKDVSGAIEASRISKKASKIVPKRVWRSLIHNAKIHNMYDEALQVFEEFVDKYPLEKNDQISNFSIHSQLCSYTGNFEKLLKVFRSAIDVDIPAQDFSNGILSCIRSGAFEEALQLYELFKKRGYSCRGGSMYVNTLLACKHLGRDKEAESVIRIAKKLDLIASMQFHLRNNELDPLYAGMDVYLKELGFPLEKRAVLRMGSAELPIAASSTS